jgi:hypothetical protein
MQQSGWRWPFGAALVLALFMLTNSAGAQEALYARIIVDPKTTVYVEFKGEEMRMAASVAGLQNANAVKAKSVKRDNINFPVAVLPLATLKAPGAFWAKVKAGLSVLQSDSKTHKVVGNYFLDVEDKNVTSLYYRFSGVAPMVLGNAPAGAPIIFTVPQPGNATLKITTRIDKNQVGIALAPMFGKWEIHILTKGRKPSATLRVTDSAGKVIANEKGGLDKFGFT